MPTACVGHIGIFRDKITHEPHQYYFKIPNDNTRNMHYYICDPMLATGGSAIQTINCIKETGADSMSFICIVAAPEGVSEMLKHHPDVPIFTASLDQCLDKNCYILPGLGDAGDRLFGTDDSHNNTN